jgi:hypothetical protein
LFDEMIGDKLNSLHHLLHRFSARVTVIVVAS